MAAIARYPNDRPKLGLVEIINNLDTEQTPTQNDVRELTHAFRWIGMEVNRPHLDLKEDEMNSKIDEILAPNRDLKEYDMFILTLICHGDIGDTLMSSDGKVCSSVTKIVEKFDAMKDMRGHPKILILEACRGDNDNLGFTFTTVKGGNQSMVRLPNRADVFIAFATVPGFVSLTETKGSSFVLTLAPKIMELAESNHHLGDIMTGVIGELRDKEIGAFKQQAAQESTLGKLLYLKKKEKTYFHERKDDDGIKYRMFGDRNGWGKICFENQEFRCCNFQDGIESFSGRRITEFPSGNVIEVDIHPGGKWDDNTGEGVMFNIRKKWKYEGQFKQCKKPGSEVVYTSWHESGIYYYDDGSFYIGAFENGIFNGYGCKISKDRQVTECGIWKENKLVKNL